MDDPSPTAAEVCTFHRMTDTKPPVAQTLTLLFENNPTWGDLIWFSEQARAAGVDFGHEIIFEWDADDLSRTGMSFFTHPDPAALLGRDA